MLPTVAEVLDMEVFRRGRCRLLAGADATSTPVRWVHVSELADIAHLLRGGELVLTTGVALPEDPPTLARYIADLAGVGAVGLVVELGRRFQGGLPPAMVSAARTHRLPLAVLDREIAFVAVTEAVHSRIVDAHLEELRRSEQLHTTFTELTLERASEAEVLRQVASLAGTPVVLEDLAHQVIEVDPAGRVPEELLDAWEERSRAVTSDERVHYDPDFGLLVGRVGAQGKTWGRLVLVCEAPPTVWHRMLLERAATALALGWLVDRDRAHDQRQTERSLLATILEGSSSEAEVAAHSKRLGVPFLGRQLVGVTLIFVRPLQPGTLEAQSAARSAADALVRASRAARVPVLVGALKEGEVNGLLSFPLRASPEETLEAIASEVAGLRTERTVLGAGPTAQGLAEARRSLLESRQVAHASRRLSPRTYYRLADLGVRGLLYLLRDDPRVQGFTERQLGPLLAKKPNERDPLFAALEAYLAAYGNKKAAAQRAKVSRTVLYERLARLEEVLGVDLGDAEQAVSLHLAVLALGQFRSPTP